MLKKQAATAWARRPWRAEADCLFCGSPCECFACVECVASLPVVPVACPGCALPSGVPQLCGECLRRPRPFDAAAARFAYRFPVDRAVQRFKFAGDLATGRFLALQLAELAMARARPDLVVAPPTTRARLAQRGFDPALEMARHVARQLRVPLGAREVRRRRDTTHQVGIDRRSRRANLRDAFECRARLEGRHVAIVDDVLTTGATVEAVALALRAAGAARIEVLALARTLEPGRD